MLIDIVIFFLGLSIVFYVLFGGADFGAGVLELITGQENGELISDAIAPVWEANHVWLILAVVILFMGFPEIYSTMSTYLHIPLLIVLIGIVLRGTAFTFRHYDVIKGRSSLWYGWAFKISSIITPLFLGITVGAMVLGQINSDPQTFYEGFIAPWFNAFCVFLGLFCLALFTFLAAVYLIGETKDEVHRKAFIKVARRINIAAVILGMLVFASAEWNGLPLFKLFYESWIAIVAVALATIILPFLWVSLGRSHVIRTRLLAGFQVFLILFAWFWIQYPVAIRTLNSIQSITFRQAAAPEVTLIQLTWALIVGSGIILPFLYFLIKTFKGAQFSNRS